MKTKLFLLLFAIVASMGVATAESFVGFEANNSNKMGDQIYSQNLIQNRNNITMVETDATKHKYNINLTNGGEGTFKMGGVTFSYTNEEAGKTAYKTYDTYIQPNGVDREIRIPTINGEQIKIVLVEACAGMLVNGVSVDFVEGNNVITASGNSVILRNPTNKPKISAILSLGGGTSDPNPDPDPEPTTKTEKVQIGDLYYNLDATNNTAEVTTSPTSSAYYYGLTTTSIPKTVTYNAKTYSVTSVGKSAFYNCTSLTSIAIGDSVTEIGDDAFRSCTSLTSVTIGNSVTGIGERAFEGCRGLTSVTIPNSVTSIGHADFRWCTSLASVTIGNSVTSIGNYAFYECTGLTSIEIPNSVVSIGVWAFGGCAGLTSVTIGNSVTSIGEGAFSISSLADIYASCGDLDRIKQLLNNDYRVKYKPLPYTISTTAQNGYISTNIAEVTICDEPLVKCTAQPDRGFYFVRWADGNTKNPRTVELTQDTTMEAIFDILLSGKCGKDSALVWKFDPSTMALEITGKGALSENYTYGKFIEELTIGNEITSIGEDAFYRFEKLENVIIGSTVKVLESYAFSGCSSIKTITCYSQRPPTVNNKALNGLDYSTIVYVPADYLETYKMHDAWGLYDVRPLGAKSTEATDVTVTPTETTAEVVWPAVSGAATYELVIKDKSGNVICTLIFNAQGQLTSIAFNAPGHNAAQQTLSTGFAFTVTGLNSGTGYDLTMTSKNSSGDTLQTKTISFVTNGPQSIDNISDTPSKSTKQLRDGQIFILRGDKVYTTTGQEVK